MNRTAAVKGPAQTKLMETSLAVLTSADSRVSPLASSTAIEIATKDQVVTLKGTVRSDAAKARAEELARKTKNVVGVINLLVVQN